jgi:hypothetical protein
VAEMAIFSLRYRQTEEIGSGDGDYHGLGAISMAARKAHKARLLTQQSSSAICVCSRPSLLFRGRLHLGNGGIFECIQVNKNIDNAGSAF